MMKSAEEWGHEIFGKETCMFEDIENMKAVQLDALKEGMRRGAALIKVDETSPNDCQTCKSVCIEAILTAAEQKTIKDL